MKTSFQKNKATAINTQLNCVHAFSNVHRALFIRAPNWKLPKCPPTAKWTHTLRGSHTVACYRTMSTYTTEPHTTRMNLTGIMSSERSHTQKSPRCVILCNIKVTISQDASQWHLVPSKCSTTMTSILFQNSFITAPQSKLLTHRQSRLPPSPNRPCPPLLCSPLYGLACSGHGVEM